MRAAACRRVPLPGAGARLGPPQPAPSVGGCCELHEGVLSRRSPAPCLRPSSGCGQQGRATRRGELSVQQQPGARTHGWPAGWLLTQAARCSQSPQGTAVSCMHERHRPRTHRASSWSMMPWLVVRMMWPNWREGSRRPTHASMSLAAMSKRGEIAPHLFRLRGRGRAHGSGCEKGLSWCSPAGGAHCRLTAYHSSVGGRGGPAARSSAGARPAQRRCTAQGTQASQPPAPRPAPRRRRCHAPAVQLHHDLARAVVVHKLELADVACGGSGGGEAKKQVSHETTRPAEPL